MDDRDTSKDEKPVQAPAARTPVDDDQREGVKRQRDHIIKLTGQDPLASRDD
ncbi:hypothetical protein ABOZ73_06560 [Caulobacter sp. 73W]|uniref:Uncharacterized protein n=1 Tax=Caulobacter sp. 73W TaxID=3161137 RepID=A0AB39KVN9_9CAUL